MKISKHKYLVGVSNLGNLRIDNTIEAIAEFICEYGQCGDLYIVDPFDRFVLNTFGIFLNRCDSALLVRDLRPVLLQRQIETATHILNGDVHAYSPVFSTLEIIADNYTVFSTCAAGIPINSTDLMRVPGLANELLSRGIPSRLCVVVNTYQVGDKLPRAATAKDIRTIRAICAGDYFHIWLSNQRQIGTYIFNMVRRGNQCTLITEKRHT